MHYLIALSWAPFAFLLHNVIHEASHALAARAFGAKITAFWPFPSKKLGRFTWAHMMYEGELSSKQTTLVLCAPLLGEALWLAFTVPALLMTTGWVKLLFLVEVIAANIDLTNWWFTGIYLEAKFPQTDGARMLKLTGLSPGVGRALTVPHLIAMLGLAWYLTNFHTNW